MTDSEPHMPWRAEHDEWLPRPGGDALHISVAAVLGMAAWCWAIILFVIWAL